MMPLVVGKTYYAAALINKEPCKLILSLSYLFVSLAFLAPLASAQRCGYSPPKLSFGSISPGPYRPTYYNQNMCNCERVESRRDNTGGATKNSGCYGLGSKACPPRGGSVACGEEEDPNCGQDSPAKIGNAPRQDSKSQPSVERLPRSKAADFNREIYYKNKLEFALDVGWLPINIPFPFDVFEGDPYDLYPLRYTLVPVVASLRWHMDDIGSPWILRGNWDLTASASATAIPRGAETHYFSYDMGIRRNFVPRNSRVAPYVDMRLGLGLIDAKGPLGVYYAQGQNFTFTANLGSGVRYNFNPRYAISAGLNWMHISNNNLSSPQYSNYGINVYGPMFGIDVQLYRHRRRSEQ